MKTNLTAKEFDANLIAFRPVLVNMATSWTRNRDDAMDVAQEVICKALENRAQFTGCTGEHCAWLSVILKNYLKSRHRRAKRVVYTDDEFYANMMVAADDPLVSLQVKQALERLTKNGGKFLGCLLDAAVGLTQAQSAAERGIAEGTVKSRVHRGRQKFKHLALA